MSDTLFFLIPLCGMFIFILPLLFSPFIFHIIATIRISQYGGSGTGFFFFSWIYILFSSKANDWKDFNKATAVVLGILTLGLFLPVYILFTLNNDKNKSTSRYLDDD
jgi:hypothetical protein